MRSALACLFVASLALLLALQPSAEPLGPTADKLSAKTQSITTNLNGDAPPAGLIRTLTALPFRHTSEVWDMAVTDDGKQLVVAAREGIVFWDLSSSKHLQTTRILSLFGNYRLALAQARDQVAVRNSWNSIKVSEVSSGKTRFCIENQAMHSFHALAFSPDGAVLACAQNRAIGLWNTDTGKLTGELVGHTGKLLDVAFHPDGKSLFSVSTDGTLRQWDLATGNETRCLIEVRGWYATRLTLSPDGKTLAVLSGTCAGGIGKEIFANHVSYVCLLDTATLKERFCAVLPAAFARDVAVSPDGRYVAAAMGLARGIEGHLRLWDSWTCKLTICDPGNDQDVNCVRFLADGKTLVSGGNDGAVRLWNVSDGKEHASTKGPAGFMSCGPFSPSGAVLASASSGTVQLWDTANGLLLHSLRQRGKTIRPIAFSPNREFILTAGDKDDITSDLWNVRTGTCVRAFQSTVGTAGFAPDGRTIAAADNDGDVRFLDIATGKVKRTLVGRGKSAYNVAYSPRGNWLADGRVAKLWFSPDGSLLFIHVLIFGRNATTEEVCVFETNTGILLTVIPLKDGDPFQGSSAVGCWTAHGGATLVYATRADFPPAAFAGSFHTIDVVTGARLGPDVEYGGEFVSAELSPDGQTLALGGADSRILLWKPPPLPPRKPLPTKMHDADLQAQWQSLAATDAKAAFRARWHLAASKQQTLPLLRSHLRPVPVVPAQQIADWIEQLDSTSFKERELAMRDLEKTADAAESALRQGLEQRPSLELRLRIEQLLGKLAAPPTGETLRTLRSIVILEAIADADAAAMLRNLADGAQGARVTEAAQAALKRLN